MNYYVTKTTLEKSMKSEPELKPYWAAYFNMARSNFYSTLTYISEIVGTPTTYITNEGETVNYENRIPSLPLLTSPLLPEQESQARTLFCKFFPFLEAIEVDDRDDTKSIVVSFKDMRGVLRNIGGIINYYRNHYSHTKQFSAQNKIEKISECNCARLLNKVTTVAVRKVKTRYTANKNSAQAGMLSSESLSFITDNKITPRYDDGVRRMSANPSYFLSAFVPDKNYQGGDVNSPKSLTTVGKLLLVCLFLEKKYVSEILTQTGFLKPFSDKSVGVELSQRRILLEVFSILSTRLPRKTLTTEKDSLTIALDMLNELKKSPSELFCLLRDEDRAKFSVESSTGEKVLLRRFSDRFPQMVMSYIDHNKIFDSLRFQYNAGQFRYLFKEDKRCLDGVTRMRVLQEPLNGFGRVHEIESRRTDESKPLWPEYSILGSEDSPRNDKDILPYISDVQTRFLIDGNNIGMHFGEFIPGITKVEDNRYKVSGAQPDCIISKYELAGMLFYHLLSAQQDKPHATEEFIRKTIDNYRRFFEDIASGSLHPETVELPSSVYDLIETDEEKAIGQIKEHTVRYIWECYQIKFSDVPAKLQEYLIGIEPKSAKKHFESYKKGLINDLLNQTKAKLEKLREDEKRINSDMNKAGRKGYVQIRPGELAHFIAEDIVFFQEGTATEKLTSMNYNIMQSLIATLGTENVGASDSLQKMFVDSGLIGRGGTQGSHPFLFKVMTGFDNSLGSTVRLYRYYLECRRRYLMGPISSEAHFLHSKKVKWQERDEQYYKDLATRYLQMPVILPRQLFEEPIFASLCLLKGKNATDLRSALTDARQRGRCNVTFMIKKYFEEYLDNRHQEFYDFDYRYGYGFYTYVRKNLPAAKEMLSEYKRQKRSTVFSTDLENAIVWATAHPESKKIESRIPDKYGSNNDKEKVKKHIKDSHLQYTEQAKALRRYIVQDILLYLAAIEVIKKELGLEDIRAYRLSDIGPDKDGILASRLTTKTKVGTKYGRTILVQKEVQMKDYGRIYTLLCDKRVPDLLKFHNNKEVDAAELLSELTIYDQRRVGTFKDILGYEEKILGLIPDSYFTGNYVDFPEVLCHDNVNTESSKTALRMIRNAFAHNQYPPKIYNDVHIHEAEVPGTAKKISDRVHAISDATPDQSKR